MKIIAVTVNHNTSHFVELMLRTLFFTNDLTGVDISFLVLDNASQDKHLQELLLYLESQKIPFVQTGLDDQVAVEKHGVALTRFVKDNPDFTHYLFLDSDIWFVEPDTIPVMINELIQATNDIFANQARNYGYYADRVIEGKDGVAGQGDLDGVTWETVCGNSTIPKTRYATHWKYRCSPACSLVANIPVFRRVVETVGLNPAISFGAGIAGHYDTFGLMTHVMATHGYRFIVSAKTVNHFTQVAYIPELRAPKDRDCMKMLTQLRSGHGMEMETFRLSEWVKQNRLDSNNNY